MWLVSPLRSRMGAQQSWTRISLSQEADLQKLAEVCGLKECSCSPSFLCCTFPSSSSSAQSRRSQENGQIASSLEELFLAHDLNNDGLLGEDELIEMNCIIARLHHGDNADLKDVRAKYKELFRTHLDPSGCPVPLNIFCAYMQRVLHGLDKDVAAQEMILDHFVAEVQSARRTMELQGSFCDQVSVQSVPFDTSPISFCNTRYALPSQSPRRCTFEYPPL